ncbi:M64 family metallopeptidase [Desulfobacter curvatus]|uniref:M64 family metallopeptidase n=1 Tax=Desulfobacter curvatus TaxID=2290 RepID=UPI00038221E5|nr:M64 family metallopeptidase [Desulfobacter curvatus]
MKYLSRFQMVYIFAVTFVALSLFCNGAFAQTVTEILRSGSNGSKKNLVIIGDGFQAADQNTYNTLVNNFIFNGVFSDDVFMETLNAFNIYRVNANSTDSGVTQVDVNGNVTTARNTAFGYRYSGIWDRCWMEPGPNSSTLINNVLNSLVPQRDFVFIILNEPGGGGCRRGDSFAVTTSSNWTTVAHEMGHMVGNLGDEYTGGNTHYTGSEPNQANLTIETDRNKVKWKSFIDPSTPVTTNCADVTDNSQDIGIFEGATLGTTRYRFDLYRSSCNDRMNSNAPAFCSVCYNRLQTVLDPYHDYTYRKSYAGDFNGDGKDDLFVFNYSDWSMPYFALSFASIRTF